MTDFIWMLAAVLAVLLVAAAGPAYQHLARHHNQRKGDAR